MGKQELKTAEYVTPDWWDEEDKLEPIDLLIQCEPWICSCCGGARSDFEPSFYLGANYDFCVSGIRHYLDHEPMTLDAVKAYESFMGVAWPAGYVKV